MHSAETVDTRTDAIAGRLRRLLNEGMVALVAGLGARDGWLDALVSVQPAGAAAVARAAGADEARVRAWLGTLVAGCLVDYDGARDTYALPPGVTAFLSRAEGWAYRRELARLVQLAAGEAAVPAVVEAGPSARELVALVPGMTERLALGADVLELRRDGAAPLCLDVAFPASRVATRERLPAGRSAAFALVVALDERAVTASSAAARVAATLAPGGAAIIAVPAISGSPGDDALHPVGAFLLGTRALSKPAARGADADTLGARLCAAGLAVHAVSRVPSDPFRNYLIARKPDSTNDPNE